MEHIFHLGSWDPLSEDPKLPPPIPPLPPPPPTPPPLLDCGGLPTTKEEELALYERDTIRLRLILTVSNILYFRIIHLQYVARMHGNRAIAKNHFSPHLT